MVVRIGDWARAAFCWKTNCDLCSQQHSDLQPCGACRVPYLTCSSCAGRASEEHAPMCALLRGCLDGAAHAV